MTAINSSHPAFRVATNKTTLTQSTNEPVCGISEASPPTGKAENRLDHLLRAFSNTAFSPEEDDLSWESWNYTKISTF